MQKEDRKSIFLANISGFLTLFLIFSFFVTLTCYSQNKVGICECKSIKDKAGAIIKQESLNEILKKHEEWNRKRGGGSKASLNGFSLNFCIFQNWNFRHINMSGASVINSKFENIDLTDADLTEVDLSNTTLSRVTIINTKIKKAKFDNAIFKDKVIFQPDIINECFVDVISLAKVKEGSLQALRFLGKKDPRAPEFHSGSLALEALLKKYNDYGFRKQAKDIIYAIQKSKMNISWSGEEGPKGYVSSVLKFVLFEITCQWGLYPINCLYLIFLTILIFSFPYMIAIMVHKNDKNNRIKRDKNDNRYLKKCFFKIREMWLAFPIIVPIIYLSFSIEQIGWVTLFEVFLILFILLFSQRPLCACTIFTAISLVCSLLIFFFNKIYLNFKNIIDIFVILSIFVIVAVGVYSYLKLHKREWKEGKIVPFYPSDCSQSVKSENLPDIHSSDTVIIALHFSFISAFNIGWRELNIGDWLSRIQPYEYSYKATGWVKVVAGIESLICTYLLALWVLTYFGSPFNW